MPTAQEYQATNYAYKGSVNWWLFSSRCTPDVNNYFADTIIFISMSRYNDCLRANNLLCRIKYTFGNYYCRTNTSFTYENFVQLVVHYIDVSGDKSEYIFFLNLKEGTLSLLLTKKWSMPLNV